MPALHLRAGLAQHPATQPDDEAGLLRQRHEVLRQQVPESGVVPPHQRLEAEDLAGLHVHHRLVVQDQLLALDRGAKRRLHLEALAHVSHHAGFVRGEAALALPLGGVHREVGVPEQVVGGFLPGGGRDPEAGRHVNFVVAEVEGGVHGLGQPLDQHRGPLVAPHVLDQDAELVPAEPRHGVRGPTAGQEPLRRGDEQPVALGVAKAVVHLLEVVEVEEQHRDVPALPARERQRVADPVAEERAVGEPGQRVVEGLVQELLLEALAFADVADVEHDAANGRVLDQVGGDGLGLERGPVGLAEPPLDGGREAGREAGVAKEGHGALPVLRHQERVHGEAEEALRIVAQHPGRRGAHEPDRPVGLDHENHVRRVLHEGAETGLVVAGSRLGEKPDVLADRKELPEDDEERDGHGTHGQLGHRLAAGPEGLDEQQPEGDGHRAVRQRAQRL